MPLIVGEGESKEFERPPAALYQAVCCDVIDRGEMMTKAGILRPKIAIVWQLDALNSKGERYEVRKTYTRSLFDKGPGRQSILAHDLQSWRGIPFTPEERKAFDLERLIGINCQITIVHQESNGKTYANVMTIVQLGKGMAKIAVENYVRQAPRPQQPSGAQAGPVGPTPPPIEDPIPF